MAKSDSHAPALRSFLRALGSALRRDTPAFRSEARVSGARKDGDGERPMLRNAGLVSADLHDAHLAHADLQGADLRNADLTQADLEEADLSGADLKGANFEHARMENVKLAQSLYSSATLFPADLKDRIYGSSTEVRPGVFQVGKDFVAP